MIIKIKLLNKTYCRREEDESEEKKMKNVALSDYNVTGTELQNKPLKLQMPSRTKY